MRYLKNQFRGRIGRTILEKKRQKSSHFYFSTPFKPSVYAVSGVWQSSCNRDTYRWQDNLSKNQPKIFPFKKIRALNAVFIRVLAVVLRGHIGETRMF